MHAGSVAVRASHEEGDAPLELSPFLLPDIYKAAETGYLGHLSAMSVVVGFVIRNGMSIGRRWHELFEMESDQFPTRAG